MVTGAAPLVKRNENLLKIARGDPNSRVAHLDSQPRVPIGRLDIPRDERNPAASRGEFHGVAKQVPNHLLEACAIDQKPTAFRRELALDRNALTMRLIADDLHCGLNKFVNVARFGSEMKFPV